MIWHEFKALGTEITIAAALNEDEDILGVAEQEIRNFEKMFSRFILDSELSLFNNSHASRREVSESMLKILTEAQNYHLETGGIFDPTIIDSLETLGYKESFEKIGQKTDGTASSALDLDDFQKSFSGRSQMSDLKIDGKIVSCPPNFRLDFGGIGKGYVVDLVSQKLFKDIKSYWIDAGGDIKIAGAPDNARSWLVEVQDPRHPDKTIFTLDSQGQELGISTSGVIKRRGELNGYKWNHLIDPRTGLSVENDILAVTVISSSATKADIFAKTVLILGEKEGLEFIENRLDSACIIFSNEQKPIFSKRAYLYLKKINMTKNIITKSLTILAVILSLIALAYLIFNISVNSSVSQGISIPWYIARAAGIASYLLMFLVITLGNGMTAGYVYKYINPVKAWVIHKYLSLALGFALLTHIISLTFDKFINFNYLDVLIPYYSSFKPLFLSLGIFGFYTLLVIIFSSLLFRIKYKKTWRGIHYAVYPLFIFSFVHGAFIGSDSKTLAMQIIYLSTGLIFLGLTIYRFFLRKKI